MGFPCINLCASANPGSDVSRGQERRLGGPGPTYLLSLREKESRGKAVAQADVLSPEGSSAICVQRFDGSRNSAIHTTYRISLRSSSLHEPSYPLLRVVFGYNHLLLSRGQASKLHFRQLRFGLDKGWFGQPSGGSYPTLPVGLDSDCRAPTSRRLRRGLRERFSVDSIDSMIPPQVHLRRPCYDFSFL